MSKTEHAVFENNFQSHRSNAGTATCVLKNIGNIHPLGTIDSQPKANLARGSTSHHPVLSRVKVSDSGYRRNSITT